MKILVCGGRDYSNQESNKDYNDGINRAIEIIEQRFHLHTEPYID